MFGGFILENKALRAVSNAASRGDAEELFDFLEGETELVRPEFTYPPFILPLAVDFVRSRVKSLPLMRDEELATLLDDLDLNLVLLTDSEEAELLLTAIDGLAAGDEELSTFFREQVEEAWDPAPDALREAFSYIRRGLIRTRESGGTFLLVTG